MTMTTSFKATKSSHTTVAQAFAGVPLVAQAVLDSPIGPLTALATRMGLAGLWFDDQRHHPGAIDAPVDSGNAHIASMRRWLDGYWAGRDPSWRGVPLDLHGTAFQRAVWQVLLTIPLGRTKSYGEVASLVGGGAVPRATGTAVGRNPVSILVPCHRVIGANGSLTGYAGGLPRKERLLQHEGVLLA
jgi:methylated-DNA-[protein]-cysteine S-methyltransferase